MSIPYLIGWASSAASSATLVISAGSQGGQGTAAGDAITVAAGNSGTLAVTGVADSQGNAYRLVTSIAVNEVQSAWVADSSNNPGGPAALAPGTDTITITYAAVNTNVKTAIAGGVTGYSGTDVVPAPTSSASGLTASISLGVLTQASEIIWFSFQNGNGGGTPTVSGCTALATASGSAAELVTLAYMVTSSTASVTGNATMAVATKWSALAFSLLGQMPPSPPAAVQSPDTDGLSRWSRRMRRGGW